MGSDNSSLNALLKRAGKIMDQLEPNGGEGMGIKTGPPPRKPGRRDIRELKERLGIENEPERPRKSYRQDIRELRERVRKGEPPPDWDPNSDPEKRRFDEGRPPASSIRVSGGSRVEDCSLQGDGITLVATGGAKVSGLTVKQDTARPSWRHPAVIASLISALGTITAALIYVLWG